MVKIYVLDTDDGADLRIPLALIALSGGEAVAEPLREVPAHLDDVIENITPEILDEICAGHYKGLTAKKYIDLRAQDENALLLTLGLLTY